jgi:hypothetical protein
MIRSLLCKLGFHQFGLFVVEEVAPDIEIARTQCRHCERRQYGDPAGIPSHLLESMTND